MEYLGLQIDHMKMIELAKLQEVTLLAIDGFEISNRGEKIKTRTPHTVIAFLVQM